MCYPWKPSQSSGTCPIRYLTSFNSIGIVIGLGASFVIAVFVRFKIMMRILSFISQDAQTWDPTSASFMFLCPISASSKSQATWNPPTVRKVKLSYKLRRKAGVGGCYSNKSGGPPRDSLARPSLLSPFPFLPQQGSLAVRTQHQFQGFYILLGQSLCSRDRKRSKCNFPARLPINICEWIWVISFRDLILNDFQEVVEYRHASGKIHRSGPEGSSESHGSLPAPWLEQVFEGGDGTHGLRKYLSTDITLVTSSNQGCLRKSWLLGWGLAHQAVWECRMKEWGLPPDKAPHGAERLYLHIHLPHCHKKRKKNVLQYDVQFEFHKFQIVKYKHIFFYSIINLEISFPPNYSSNTWKSYDHFSMNLQKQICGGRWQKARVSNWPG